MIIHTRFRMKNIPREVPVFDLFFRYRLHTRFLRKAIVKGRDKAAQWALWGNAGDAPFVNGLNWPPRRVQFDGIRIEASHGSPQRHTANQVYGHGSSFFAQQVQERVLDVALVSDHNTALVPQINRRILRTMPERGLSLRLAVRQMFARFPHLDGLVIRISETYLRGAPNHTGAIKDKTESDKTIIPLMQLLRDAACTKLGKKSFSARGAASKGTRALSLILPGPPRRSEQS